MSKKHNKASLPALIQPRVQFATIIQYPTHSRSHAPGQLQEGFDVRPRILTSRISIITLGVSDMAESLAFYRDGLGFPTSAIDADGWAIFRTSGSRLAIFPKAKLAEDIGVPSAGTGFGGIALAHNTDSREEVDALIERAIKAGGKLLKSPQPTSWGGNSGYFADSDGYPWEIAWGEDWLFDDQGILWGGSLGNPPMRTSRNTQPPDSFRVE